MNNRTQPTHPETAPAFELCAADLATVIRMPQLIKMVGMSRSMIYLKINAKSRYFDSKFPKPIQLGEKAIGFYFSDVFEYIRSLKSNKTHRGLGY